MIQPLELSLTASISSFGNHSPAVRAGRGSQGRRSHTAGWDSRAWGTSALGRGCSEDPRTPAQVGGSSLCLSFRSPRMYSPKSHCQTLWRSGSAFGKPPWLWQQPVSLSQPLGSPCPPGMGTGWAALPGAGNGPAQGAQQQQQHHCLPCPDPLQPNPCAQGRRHLQGTNCKGQTVLSNVLNHWSICNHFALQTVQIWVQFNRLNYMCSSSLILYKIFCAIQKK